MTIPDDFIIVPLVQKGATAFFILITLGIFLHLWCVILNILVFQTVRLQTQPVRH